MSAFTAAEDALLLAHYPTMTLHGIAALLERPYANVQGRASRLARRGQLDPTTRHYQRPWTEDDADYLNDAWGKLPDRAIAHHLNRSLVAVTIKAKRLGLTRRGNVWTATNVAELFGVDPKTVIRWLGRGWIAGQKASFGAGGQRGEYRAWSLDEDSVERFVRTMGWAYDWRRMIEGEYLTRLARSLHKADPWLTLEECGKLLRHNPGTIYRWTREGLPHEHRPKQGQSGPIEGIIVVLRSTLHDFYQRHRAAAQQHRSASAKLRCRRQAVERMKGETRCV